jgi:hypothetical protein
MSHTDNTQHKHDPSHPKWLAFKLWLKHVDPEDRRYESRQAENRQWRKDMRMELSA